MSNIKIRKALQKDLEQLIDLCDEHAAHEDIAYTKTGKKERLALHLFSDNPPLTCLVVEHEGKLKGYATYMKEYSTWDASYYMHMDCLFLMPELRGQGIGSKIVKRIKAEAEDLDCVNIQWQTPTNNVGAIEFYNKLGAVSRNKKRFYLL